MMYVLKGLPANLGVNKFFEQRYDPHNGPVRDLDLKTYMSRLALSVLDRFCSKFLIPFSLEMLCPQRVGDNIINGIHIALQFNHPTIRPLEGCIFCFDRSGLNITPDLYFSQLGVS